MAKGYVYSYVDPTADPIRGYETINTSSYAWGSPNIINASVTGLLSGLATIFSAWVPGRVYDYYEQQERLAIENAAEQARRIRIKGDIELRNLEIDNAIMQGKNELAAAASGTNVVTNVSGSMLDMLVQNKRYAALDERTVALETLWAESNAKREGYVNAINVAGQAMTTAYKQRSGMLKALTATVKGFATDLLADKRSDREIQYYSNLANRDHTMRMGLILNTYGTTIDPTLGYSGSSSGIQQKTASEGISSGFGTDPNTGINMAPVGSTDNFDLIRFDTMPDEWSSLRIS